MEKAVETMKADLVKIGKTIQGLVEKRKALVKSGGSADVAEIRKKIADLRVKSESLTEDVIKALGERKKLNTEAKKLASGISEAKKKARETMTADLKKIDEQIADEKKASLDIRKEIKSVKYGEGREKSGKPVAKKTAKTVAASTNQSASSKQE